MKNVPEVTPAHFYIQLIRFSGGDGDDEQDGSGEPGQWSLWVESSGVAGLSQHSLVQPLAGLVHLFSHPSTYTFIRPSTHHTGTRLPIWTPI